MNLQEKINYFNEILGIYLDNLDLCIDSYSKLLAIN